MDVPTQAGAAAGNTWFAEPAAPLPERNPQPERALLAAVAAACAGLAEAAELAEGLQAACDALVRWSGLDRAYVFELSADGRQCLLVSEATRPGVGGIEALWGSRVFEVADCAEVWQPLRAGRVYESVHTGRQGANAELSGAVGSLSDLMVPVMVEGRCWGCLGFDYTHEPRRYPVAEVQALGTVAHALGGALLRARLQRLLQGVVAATRELAAPGDLDHTLPAALHCLRACTGADRVFVNRYDAPSASTFFWCESRRDDVPPFTAGFGPGPWPDADFAEVALPLKAGQVVRTRAAQRSGRNAAANAINDSGSDLIVPILAEGRYVACIGFDDRAAREWTDAEVAVLEGATAAIAAAWLRARAEAAARQAQAERLARAEADAAALREREGLLRTATQAAQALLGGADFDAGIAEAFACLGQSLNVDRVGLVEQIGSAETGDLGRWRLTHEWTRPGLPRQMDSAAATGETPTTSFATEQQAGEVTVLTIGHGAAPFDAGQAQLQVATILSVPVFVRGTWWGSVGFDQNEGARPWAEHEISMLQTTAACVGAALERRDADAARLATARQRTTEAEALSGLLEGVVMATRELLDASDFATGLNAWLARLGQAAGADVALLIEHFDAPQAEGVARWNAQWRRAGAANHPGPVPATSDFIDWQTRLHAGGTIWAHIDELQDPASVQFWRDTDCETNLLVPITLSGRTPYVLCFDWHRRQAWQPAYGTVLRTAAESLAAVLQRQAAAQALADERERRVAAERRRADDNARLARLLSHVVHSSRALIDADTADFEARLLQWLGDVGREAQAQRATFYDIVGFEPTGQPTARMLCEWVAEGVLGSVPVSFAEPFVIDPRGGKADMQRLLSGAVAVFHADEMSGPMQAFLREQGNATVVAVPLFIEQRQWGCISFDYPERQELAASIVAVLQTAADTLAAVLRRNDIAAALMREREARVEAERRRADEAAAHAARMERHSRLLAAVAQSAEELLAARDLDAALHRVLEHIGPLTGADRACISRLEWTPADPVSWGWQSITHEWARPGRVRQRDTGLARFAMRRDDPTWAATLRRLQTEGSIVARIESMGEPFRSQQQALGVAWALCHPVLADGAVAGIAGFDFATPFGEYDQADLAALRTVTAAISDALARRALEQRTLQAEQQRSAALARVSESLRRTAQQVAEGVSLERMLGAALIEGAEICGALTAVVHRVERSGQVLQLMACVTAGQPLDLATDLRVRTWCRPVSMARAAPWLARLSCDELRAQNLAGEAGLVFNPESLETHVAFGHRYLVQVPLYAGNDLVGVMGLCFTAQPALAELDADHVRAVGHLMATALQMEQLSEAARRALLAGERERLQRERAAELARANEVLRGALAALPGDAEGQSFLATALAEIVTQAGAWMGHLFRYDEEAELMRLVGSSHQGRWSPEGEADDPPHFRTGYRPLDAAMAQLLAQRRVQWVNIADGTRRDFMLPATHAWHLRHGHQATAFQVLAVGPRLVGLVGLTFRSAVPPPDVQLELVHALGQPMALALELARLARLARRGAEQAAVLGERNRLAREIHDGIAQSFLAIGMQLDTATARPGAPADAALLQARAMAAHGLAEARRAVAALRPYEMQQRKLPAALRELLIKRLADSGLQLTLELPPRWQPLPADVEDHLFRIVQEAVNNVLRHAAATALRVELSQAGGESTVLVADDGRGFDVSAASGQSGFGLESMRQRAGHIGAGIALHSAPGRGTQILVSWLAPETGDGADSSNQDGDVP